jgi:protein ImuA
MAEDRFAGLRRRIAEIEGRSTAVVDLDAGARAAEPGVDGALAPRRGGGPLPLGIAALDEPLAGGLHRGGLHEIRSGTTREAAGATGFAVAILARLMMADDRPVLWIAEASAMREAGLPYGIGLAGFGCDPTRLIVVRVRKPAEALWVFEEGLACRGLAAALTELRGNPGVADLTASRRLSLRARDAGVTGLFLRQAGEADASVAETRWAVAPLPAAPTDDFPAGIGRAAWRLTLERNRRGRTGTFDVEWDHERRAFAPAGSARAAHPRPVAAHPADRPDRASGPAALVA